MKIVGVLCMFLCLACSPSPPSPKIEWQYFSGRNTQITLNRPVIYRARFPQIWQRVDSPTSESIFDSRIPLAELIILEDNNRIRVTLHNFPTNSSSERIPPQAQIERWKKQFDFLEPASLHIFPEARGGFSGLFFEATGMQKGVPVTVMGWSMQLSIEHYRTLSKDENELFKQMRSDYTIKAVGSPELFIKHRNSLIEFANSFELINEIPAPL